MARHAFSGGQVCTEKQIANEGSDSNSQHDPAIVSHEKQPDHISGALSRADRVNLHDEEAVEDLDRIESSLDDCAFPLDCSPRLIPCAKQ